ncbi:hypothetical protein FHS81_003592 [Pseudochelatococcus contaminans]|uniref:Uncharacterized protein n=1 Tax=Pseudochelatococcus contaminans TaxID=1538103 RepID=A0A7W6EJ63_9HYPH|nr:hypothetical protein [Pseudochelatococcus contaminans]
MHASRVALAPDVKDSVPKVVSTSPKDRGAPHFEALGFTAEQVDAFFTAAAQL